MAAYNYKGYVIVETNQVPRSFRVHGFFGTFPTVKAAKQAIDLKSN